MNGVRMAATYAVRGGWQAAAQGKQLADANAPMTDTHVTAV
jgi:hypothetical protein